MFQFLAPFVILQASGALAHWLINVHYTSFCITLMQLTNLPEPNSGLFDEELRPRVLIERIRRTPITMATIPFSELLDKVSKFPGSAFPASHGPAALGLGIKMVKHGHSSMDICW